MSQKKTNRKTIRLAKHVNEQSMSVYYFKHWIFDWFIEMNNEYLFVYIKHLMFDNVLLTDFNKIYSMSDKTFKWKCAAYQALRFLPKSPNTENKYEKTEKE